jgi:hypothetical protein
VGSRLVLEVCLEMLLHVVGTGELLGAALEAARDGLFGRVNLGMPRGVPRRGERLLAAVRVPVAAGEALAGPLAGVNACGGGGGGGGGKFVVILIRDGTAVAVGARPPF